jgi:hypothetical protein
VRCGGWRITEIVSFLLLIAGTLANLTYPDWWASMNDLLWALPLAVFIGTIVVGFLVAPYAIYDNKQKECGALAGELNKIETMVPNFVLKKIDQSFLGNVVTTLYDESQNKVTQEIEHPYFTRIWIANDPTKPTYGVEALYVYGEIEFWDEYYKKCHFCMGGRWAETKEISQNAEPIEIEQISIPPNGRPYCMDIGLKYLAEQEFYGYNNETLGKHTKGFRDMDRKLDKGVYIIRARFRCKGVDTSFYFKLDNLGKDNEVRLKSILEPPTLDKKDSQT